MLSIIDDCRLSALVTNRMLTYAAAAAAAVVTVVAVCPFKQPLLQCQQLGH